MTLVILKKFTPSESNSIFNLDNRIFLDNNGNVKVINDTNYTIFEYQNELTNQKIQNDTYDGLLANVNNKTMTTKTIGIINNDKSDNNPCLSENGKWILFREKQNTPQYFLGYSSAIVPEVIRTPNIFVSILLAILLFLIYIFVKEIKNKKNL